ncbi:Lrs4p [Sporobolomyces salmoneus]|uniref:Lrs4p n=1 Tax=Sporobolomyces salmoneus TaxID=183962 RepID=UPI00317BDAF5
MISNVLCLTLLVSAAVAQPTHKSHASKDTPPSTPKSPRHAAPIRRSTGFDAIGSPDSVNNILSIPILSNIAGDNSNTGGLLDLRERGLLDDLDLNLLGDSSENHQTTTNIVGDRNNVLTVAEKRTLQSLRERGLLDDLDLDDLDLNLLGDYTENHQTTTNVAGNANDVTTLSQKRALLDLGNVNVLGSQSESTTTTTNVQGNGNNVNVNSNNNNKNSVIENNAGGVAPITRTQRVYYDDDDDFVCTGGSNRGRSGGQRKVKVQQTHTQRAVKQRKEAYRNKVAKSATTTWRPTHRPTNNFAGCPAAQTHTVTKWATKWNEPSTVTRWNQAATVTKWDTKTVTKNVFVAAPTPTPTRNSLLGLDLDANVNKIASAALDLNILRQ